jgi:hypothetical protein
MPSFPVSAIGACDAIRVEATAIAKDNAAFNLGRATGALDFITNPDNRQTVETREIEDGETVRSMAIYYDQRTKPCQVSTDPNTNICSDTGTTVTRKRAIVDIDKKISSPGRYFTVDDMAVLCGPKTGGNNASRKSEFIRMRLENDLRATRERFDEIILAEMNARVGRYYGWENNTGTGYRNIQLLDSNNTNQPDQDLPLGGNFVDIMMDYQNMQFSGVPNLIGQGILDKFIRLSDLACCNAAIPYEDAIQRSGVAYYFDQAANSVLGTNKFIVVPSGILHLLTYNINRSINFSTDLEAHTVVPDPVNPQIRWNLDFKWDCDAMRWKYMYSLHWTLFNVYQSDSFGTDTGTPDCGDELAGITGVWGYTATQG